MRARLLLIPFIFSVPAYGQDISSDAAANPPGQVKYAPVRNLSQLPMDGGWTYGEVLDKAAAGDFRANMLAGEYWMGLYYLNRSWKRPSPSRSWESWTETGCAPS